ncbi:NAD(P)-binding protein [Wilcoxina mikolae CBS 423.85]|nr:NAD(P)-binding protein [Wilcoxina mikolae CBS 423.85]
MSADKRLAQISSHLTELPSIPQIAGDSVGKRLVGKLGIGRATAHQYAHNGLKALYICDYDSSNLESLQAEIEAANPGVKVHARTFDASSEEAVQAVCEDAVATYGRLDIFYANAGISGSALTLVTDIAVDQFMWTLKTNVVSVFLAVKHASKAMMKTSAEKPHSGGSIIATASTAGIHSGAGATDYSASKAAVISIMQTSAFQLAGSNIRCNAICPGLIETGMTAPLWEAARARGSVGKIGQINPLRRGGVADEIARVALFLGSDESSYVNAQFWAVDGGLSGSHPTVRGKFA